MKLIGRPDPENAPHWYRRFFELVPGDNLLEALVQNKQQMLDVFDAIPPEAVEYRYAPDKWSTKQVFIHLADEERYYAYKAFCYSRQTAAQLEIPMGSAYTSDFNADNRTMDDIREDLIAVRNATITLFQTMTPEMLDFKDLPSKDTYCARSLGWFIAGHNKHHLNLIKKHYLI